MSIFKRSFYSLFFLFGCLLATQVYPQKVTIATTEYAPFTSSQAQYGGFVNRVILKAFELEGYQVELRYVPWKRALADGEKAKVDAVSFSFTNADRENIFFFSDTISDHRELLFHQKKTKVPDWKNLDDLKGLKFGLTRGYSYTPELWAAVKGGRIKADETASDEQNLKKLASGRIDIFPLDEVTGWLLIKNKIPVAQEMLTTHAKPFRATTGHLIISRSHPKGDMLLEAFNSGIKKLRVDGTYRKYLDELFEGTY